MLGSWPIPTDRLTPPANENPTDSACMTCTETSGSGVLTGMLRNTTRFRQRMIPPARRPEQNVFFVEEPGCFVLAAVVPQSGSHTTRAQNTSTWDFAWRLVSMEIFLSNPTRTGGIDGRTTEGPGNTIISPTGWSTQTRLLFLILPWRATIAPTSGRKRMAVSAASEFDKLKASGVR